MTGLLKETDGLRRFSNADLTQRSNHRGAQAISTITGLPDTLDVIEAEQTAQDVAIGARPTSAALGGDAGTSLVASKRDASAYRRSQEAKNKDNPPHLLDMTPGALHAAILAGTSTQSINEFMTDAAVMAMAEGYPVVQLPPGQAVISDTVFLDSAQSFLGVGFQGPGIENLVLLQDLDVGDTEKPLFRMRGGSGASTNKRLSGFSVRPADVAFNGRGQLVEIDGQCFATIENVYGERLHTLIALANRTSGNFTEKCIIRDIRSVDCQRGVSFIRYTGNDSFHGHVFDGLCQFNIPNGGYGLWLEGLDAGNVAFVYNSHGNFRMFGGSGTRTAIYCENAITKNLDYRFTVEDPCTIKIADAGSRFHSKGLFESTHTITLDAVSNGQILFENLRNGSAFSNSIISSMSPSMLPPALSDRNDVGDFPAIFKMADGAIGLSVFNTGNAGFYFGNINFEGKLESFAPTFRIDHDGTNLRSYNASVAISVGAASDLSGTFDATGFNLDTGNVLKVGGVQVVGAQGAAVADAAAATYVAPAGGATIDAEVRAAIVQLAADVASLRSSLNTANARLRAHGLIAT